jgi:U1 small nuclear ribonucleoprotein
MTREREYFFGEERRGGGRGRPQFQHKSQAVKALKETMQTGHRTGLPPNLLEYFTPRPPLPVAPPLPRKKKPVPFSGVAGLVEKFAGPQDPEEVHEQEPKIRLFRNPELGLQCRLNTETKPEK